MFLHTPEEVLPALTYFGKNFPFAGTKRKKKHKWTTPFFYISIAFLANLSMFMIFLISA